MNTSGNAWHSGIGVAMIAGFSFQGVETIGVAAGEAENPSRTIPRAIRQTFWRILVALSWPSFAIGWVLVFFGIIAGVGAAFLASCWATVIQQGEVYFDSVTMFVFFLLGGRYLEMTARQKAVSVTEALAKLLPAFAQIMPNFPVDRSSEQRVVADLHPGDVVLVRPGDDAERIREHLAAGLIALCGATQASSVHVTFAHKDEWAFLAKQGFLQRTDQQFHWHNEGYGTFEDFLATLASRHRKAIRRERRRR